MCAHVSFLAGCVATYVETEVTLVNREVNPLFANIAADDETVVLNRFALRLPDDSVEPYIDLVYTFRA